MRKSKNGKLFEQVVVAGMLGGLFLCGFFNYLLFHSFVGSFNISIAFAVFMVSWNAKKYNEGSYIIFLGIAYLFIGFLDLMYIITFNEFTVFTGYSYCAEQFWVAKGLMESVTMLAIFSLNTRLKERLSYEAVFSIYFIVAALSVLSILYFEIFPRCYVEGVGYTQFRIWAEAAIVLILLLAWRALDRNRKEIGDAAYPFLVWALVFTLLSELSFLIDAETNGLFNMIGQFTKMFSYYMIYKVAIDLGIRRPYDAFFRELQQNETSLKDVALVDVETGILNRRAYERIKGKLWLLCRKSRTNFGVTLISINNFEKLKSEYGKNMSWKVTKEFISVTEDVISADYFFFRMEENVFLILFGEEEEKMMNRAETIRKRMVSNVKSKYGIESNINYGISERDSLISYSLEGLYESANENLSRKKLRYMIDQME